MTNQGVTYSQLQDLMEDFYQLTTIRISFWSAAGEKLFMAPTSGNSDFCSKLRQIHSIYPVFYQNTSLGYFMYGQVRNESVDSLGKLLREKLYRDYFLNAEEMNLL